MKIGVAMIIAYFPPVVGGTEIQALRLAKILINRGVNPFIITRKLRGLKIFEEIEGVPVYRLFTLGSGAIASLSFMFSSLLFLIKTRKKYQIIHAYLASSPAITATVIAKLLKKKVVVKFGCSGKAGNIQTSNRTFQGRLKLGLLKRYGDFFVSPSRDVGRELIDYGFDKKKVVEIPNGVDIDLFQPVDKLQKEDLKKQFNFPSLPVVTYSGRLESRKRIAILLKAWEKVIKVKGSYLVILGDGSQKRYLINLAKDLQIGEYVRFTGQVHNVNEYLQASDGFVFPSSAEGLSNALLEAMATALGIVATKIGGTEEAIEDRKNGILVEPENMGELVKGILELLAQPELALKLGRKAREKVKQDYSIGMVAEKHLELYREMVK